MLYQGSIHYPVGKLVQQRASLKRASLKRASKAVHLIFMYMYYIYADEISIISAYFGLPQCTASGPAGYSCQKKKA
jgi:hypothetical protein